MLEMLGERRGEERMGEGLMMGIGFVGFMVMMGDNGMVGGVV